MRRNPIRDTVTHYVSAGRRKQSEKKTTVDFFRDLENRGPFQPNSLFEKWTTEIREEMQEAGEWITDDEETHIEFIAHYISRLQQKFIDACPELKVDLLECTHYGTFHVRCPRRYKAFKMVYIKIRGWGLRMKKFGLCALSSKAVCSSYIERYRKPKETEYLKYERSLYSRPQMVNRRMWWREEHKPTLIQPPGKWW